MLLLVALAAPWTRIPSDNADGAGMLAHLHALFEARELLYDDEYARLGMSPLFAFVTEAGLVSNHWPIGASFVQAPGWLLGRGAGEQLVGASVSDHAATWVIPLLGLRAWAILVMVALVLGVHRWLRARSSGGVASLATLALALGTPLLYYATEAPMRPHLWGALIGTIAVARWFDAVALASREPTAARARGAWPAIELGAWLGLATAIRPQLAPLVVLVAHERWLATAGLATPARVRRWLAQGLLAALAWLPWALLNLRMQAWMYGDLSRYGGEVSHHLRAFMLSTHHGALVWCPVLVVGLLGLAIGLARRRPGAGLLLALLALQIWLDAGSREITPFSVLGTRTWTGGTAFGPRKLLDAIGLLLPAAIWLHEWLAELEPGERAKWQRRLALVTVASVIPTALLHVAAWLDPRVTSEVMDGERLLIAMALPFDPHAWTAAFAGRELPLRVTATVAGVVALPLAATQVVLQRRMPSGERRRTPMVLALGVAVAGVLAQLWIAWLIARTDAMVAAHPQRMVEVGARMAGPHRAVVAAIPSHHRVLRERLGDEAVE